MPKHKAEKVCYENVKTTKKNYEKLEILKIVPKTGAKKKNN